MGEVSPPIWFKEGFRLDADSYIKALRTTLIPWIRKVAAAHRPSAGTPAPILWQQDSVPAHWARKTQAYLKKEKIPFWSPEQWPPNSPDLNPLDYAIWSKVSSGACKTRPKSVTALKSRVSKHWNAMKPDEIHKICRRFRPRLERYIVEMGHFFY